MICLFCLHEAQDKALIIKEYKYWRIFVDDVQMTLGNCLIASNDHVEKLIQLSNECLAELPQVITALEAALEAVFQPDKIHYWMINNFTSHVHFNVVPRYRTERTFGGISWSDPRWGKAPDYPRELCGKEPLATIQAAIRGYL